MSDQDTTQEPNTDTTQEPSEAPSFKDDPKYVAMSKQLAEYRDADTARKEAETTAKREAEAQKLKDEGRFDELEANHVKELDTMKALHDKAMLEMKIRNELLKVKFENDIFINGAIVAYNAEEFGNVSAYVETLKSDEANKAFLAGSDGRTVHTPPAATPGGTTAGEIRGQKIREYADSDDPEKIKIARDIKKAYFDKHRTFNGLYD